jgi:Na+/H+ antiporter NhaC
MIFRVLIIFLFVILLPVLAKSDQSILKIDRKIHLSGVTYNFEVSSIKGYPYLTFRSSLTDGKIYKALPKTGIDSSSSNSIYRFSFPHSGNWYIFLEDSNPVENVRVIPGWFSLLPPLIAIFLALLTRQVLVALFAGIWFGSTVLLDYNPFYGLLGSFSNYISQAALDPERMAILIFSLTLGGMVGVISKAGGTQGIVELLSRYAKSPRTGQIATWAMGVLVFFDDYANTLIVGNTMRPLTDRLKISREKLAYLVDSTAAPVATMAIISTWIGYQLSLISEAFHSLNLDGNAYITFFKTIPYNFYPIFALVFGFFIAYYGRDLFKMHRAEVRARKYGKLLSKNAVPIADLTTSELSSKENIPKRWFNGLIPIAVVIVSTLVGLWFTGISALPTDQVNNSGISFIQYVSRVIGHSNSFDVLMWAAFSGSIIAILLALMQRILTLNEALNAWVAGVKAMIMAGLILILAWSIGNICKDIQTADYVIAVTDGLISPHFLPLITFLLAGIIAFSTGTSWGTMAILTPIVIPLAYQLPLSEVHFTEGLRNSIFLSSIASILAGSTLGDHCSPISDTTIMSSMATGSDHIDHVYTQLPYALIVACASIVFGYLPAGFGLNPFWGLAAGTVILILFIRLFGKTI